MENKNIFINAVDQITGLFSQMFITPFMAAYFILGIILFFIGLFALFAFIRAHMFGQRVNAKIIGVTSHSRTKTKIRDGIEETETKYDESLILEYKRADGTLHREICNGFTPNKGYKTGQTIEVLVNPCEKFDDVNLANSYGSLIMGIIFVILGGWLFGGVYIAAKAKKMILLTTAIILVPGLYKMYEFISETNKKVKEGGEGSDLLKRFKDEDIMTLEDYVKGGSGHRE